MTLDFIALVVLGLLSYLGWRSGAIAQVLRIIAAIAVLVFGPYAATFTGEVIFGETGFATPGRAVAAYCLGAALLYATVVGVGWLVIKTMRAATPTLATADRAGGAALGAVKALIIIYALLGAAVLLRAPLEKRDPDDKLHVRDSMLAGFAEKYDAFSPWKVMELESLHRLVRIGMSAREHGVEHVIRENQAAADLLRSPRIKELMGDESLQSAVSEGRFAQTLGDDRVRKLLNDKEFMAALGRLDLDALEAAIAPRTPPPTEAPVEPAAPPTE